MKKTTKIAIIGAGAIGLALGKVLKKKNGNRIVFFDAAPGKVKGQRSLLETLAGADFAIFCLPSFALREALAAAVLVLGPRSVVVSVSKGVETDTGLTTDKLLEKILPARQPFAVLFGPMLAAELAAGKRGYGVAAGRGGAAKKVSALFRGTHFAVSPSDDLAGVALCGVLKNIYCVGLGMISAFATGDNVRGAYVSAACREMVGIVKMSGGRPETALQVCGLGDLVATGYNAGSRNWQVGLALARFGRSRHGSEGARSAAAICRRLGKKCSSYKLLAAINAVIAGRAKAPAVIEAI
jgi:glycerol-3-phosphate dehydrogenase